MLYALYWHSRISERVIEAGKHSQICALKYSNISLPRQKKNYVLGSPCRLYSPQSYSRTLRYFLYKWILLTKRQAFSTTPICGRDMAKLTLIGNLVRDPETRLTKNDKEYMVYASISLLHNAKTIPSSQIYYRYPRSCSSCRCKWRYDNATVVSTMFIDPGILLERPPSPPTFHRIISFSEMSNKYLRGMRKGSKVYAETTFELREPETGADPNSPQGQRQIFLKHGAFFWFCQWIIL